MFDGGYQIVDLKNIEINNDGQTLVLLPTGSYNKIVKTDLPILLKGLKIKGTGEFKPHYATFIKGTNEVYLTFINSYNSYFVTITNSDTAYATVTALEVQTP